MVQVTRRGLAAARVSWSSPKRASRPGRKLSITTSAASASRRASAPATGWPRSRVIARRLRLTAWKYAAVPSAANGGPQRRVSSPVPGASTLITSAPRSASCMVAKGPARMRDRSRTFRPSSGAGGPEAGRRRAGQAGAATALHHAGVGDDAALAAVDGGAGGLRQGGVLGDQDDLAQQVDELLGDAHEVAGGDVLLGQHLLQRVAARPAVGQLGEAGIDRPRQLQTLRLLVRVDLVLQPRQIVERRAHPRGGRRGRL